MLNALSPEDTSNKGFSVNDQQQRHNTTEPDEVDDGDMSFCKDLSSYAGGSVASLDKASFDKQIKLNSKKSTSKPADAEQQSPLSKGPVSEHDLMIAMMNIEDDISISLNKNQKTKPPKIIGSKFTKDQSTVPNSATFKLGDSDLSKMNINCDTMTSFKKQGLNHTPKDSLNVKKGTAIPDLIKNAIAQTIKATESPDP